MQESAPPHFAFSNLIGQVLFPRMSWRPGCGTRGADDQPNPAYTPDGIAPVPKNPQLKNLEVVPLAFWLVFALSRSQSCLFLDSDGREST